MGSFAPPDGGIPTQLVYQHKFLTRTRISSREVLPLDPETDIPNNEPAAWTAGLKTPRNIARILGLILFTLLYWLQAPPTFLQREGPISLTFTVVLWLGELLAYAIGVAGIIVIVIFAGNHVYYLLRGARRWFRLQEIRSWRAKRECNNQNIRISG